MNTYAHNHICRHYTIAVAFRPQGMLFNEMIKCAKSVTESRILRVHCIYYGLVWCGRIFGFPIEKKHGLKQKWTHTQTLRHSCAQIQPISIEECVCVRDAWLFDHITCTQTKWEIVYRSTIFRNRKVLCECVFV